VERSPGLTAEESTHLDWLVRGPIRRDGLVRAWCRGGEPSHPSLQTTGALLSHHVELLRRDTVDAALRHEVTADAAILARALATGLDDEGVVVQRGVRYAFDTAIVAAALDRLRGFEPRLDVRTDAQRAGAPSFLKRCLLEGRGQEGAAVGVTDARWSLSFAPHLLKLSIALDGPALRPLLSRMIAGYWRGGWFRAAPGREAPHPHAHAYALEGLALMYDRDMPVPAAVIDEGFASLLQIVEDPRTTTDVLAQTLRLALIDRRGRSERTVERLVRRVRERAHPDGGFRYTAAADADRTAEATIVALQALRWLRLDGEVAAIL